VAAGKEVLARLSITAYHRWWDSRYGDLKIRVSAVRFCPWPFAAIQAFPQTGGPAWSIQTSKAS
jgi:hypothetical protein